MDEVVLTDHQAMELALAEARRGAGFVSPNPQVGCVILSSRGLLLGKGFHQKFGGPHAEINALATIPKEKLQSARVFVTLEPCAHQGKTGSCAKALALLPLAEVIYGILDPNPMVSGQGAEILRAAGIKVSEYQGSLKSDLEEVCEHFLVNMRQHRPFISIKVASSLDGQLALKSGESKWITSEQARQYGHFLRATHDATLIGQGTLEADNPSLDVRHPSFPGKRNQVIVLLSKNYFHLRPREMNILKTHSEDEVYFLKREPEGYRRLEISDTGELKESAQSRRHSKSLTPSAGDQSKFPTSVLIEGGAAVISSFIDEMAADRLYLFQAPILLGAKGGKAWTEGIIIDSMTSKISLRNTKVERFGDDFLITGRFKQR